MLVAAAVWLGAQTASAVSVTTTHQPLPGSQFQGADGNQQDDHGLIDWQGYEASGRVQHSSDPNASDNIFGGGSHNLDPEDWRLATHNGGSSPSAGNILDTYRAFDRPPEGDSFLYLAFTRESGNGSSSFIFELNQDARVWTNDRGARIPCRRTGDIQIELEQEGNSTSVHVNRWITNHTDHDSGCAESGHLDGAHLSAGRDVQAAFNGDTIHAYLPGFYSGTISRLHFGEAAINLSAVLDSLHESCTTFVSTWMSSRASASENSQLKDYVTPEPFTVRPCKASPELSSSASASRGSRHHHPPEPEPPQLGASISDTARLSRGAAPTGTLTFKMYGPHNPLCIGTPRFSSTSTVTRNGYYRSGSFTPATAGTYRWVVSYSGDEGNHPAGPTACNADTERVFLARAQPNLSSSASALRSPAVSGQGASREARAPTPIHDTASLTDGVSPTGRIKFRLYGPTDSRCSRRPIFDSTVTVSGNGPYNSEAFTPATTGTYRWVVSYSGDFNNRPVQPTRCGEPAETVRITTARPVISTFASAVTSAPGLITDEATLTRGSNPTGTISFRVYGPDAASCTGSPIGSSTVSVSGNGVYRSPPVRVTAAGSYRWIAQYSGDSDNRSAGPTRCRDRAEAVDATPVTPPASPALSSVASASAPAGGRVHDTANLTGGASPGGTIGFLLYGPGDDTCTGAPVFESTTAVSGDGPYDSGSFTPQTTGAYRWVVSYSGDQHNRPAGPTGCGDSSETVSVSRAQPGLTVTASHAPRAAHSSTPLPSSVVGTPVSATGQLSGGSAPTHTITFALYGPNDDTCKRPPAFTAEQTVNGNGSYHSPAFTPNQAGSYLWVGHYSGDSNNAPAGTVCGATEGGVVVRPRTPALSSSASPPANLGHRARSLRSGLSIYDTATLSNGSAPTGEITFRLFGPGDITCSGTPLFTTATAVHGNGTYNSQRFTATASGTYRWLATYSGDANNTSSHPTSCSDPAEHVLATLPATPQLTTGASAAVTIGGAVHDTAYLLGGVAPTRTITFRLFGPDDTTCAGDQAFTSTVGAAGNGAYTSEPFTPTSPGVYRWVVDYQGDSRNEPAGPTACGDSAEAVVVRPAAFTPVTPAFSTTASEALGVGTPVHDTAHLTDGLAPSGAITFALYGPDDSTCTKAPVFTTSDTVTGNGNYRSASYVVPQPGIYRWVARYSGDASNLAAGPTACGEGAESITVSAVPHPNPDPGPNTPPPPKPKPKPKPKPPPPPPPPPPPTSGLG